MEWNVKIKGSVIKTINVEADTEEDAIELAHELFTLNCEGTEEDYDEETMETSRII